MPDEPRDRLLSRLGGSKPIGLAAFDRDLRYFAINDWMAELNGRTVADHIGKTMRDVAPLVADELEPIMREIIDGGEPVYGIPVAGRDLTTGEWRSTEVSFFGLDDPKGRRMALGCVVVDMTPRERALSRVALLQDAITTVTAASDAVSAAEALVSRALEAVDAQGTGIAFATDDGFLEFVAVAGPLGEIMGAQYGRVPISAPAPACEAYREGRAIWLPTRAAWQAQYPLGANLVEQGAHATFIAPLEATITRRRLGILGVAFDHEPSFDADDIAIVTAFSQQAAQALERIVLHDSERILRERFQLLAALGSRLDEEIELNARIEAFLDVVVPAFATSTQVQLSETAGDDALHARREGEATTIELEQIKLPLVAHGGIFGSVTFERSEFSAGDHVLSIELSRRLANALENARLYARERALAETLQLSLLPRRVPDVPAAQVWARYLPGTDLVVGGDFWDVIELPFQRLLLVVGDVAGRGEPAAIVMGRLRTVIRSVADADLTPASLISALNRFLVEHEDEMATCLCAILDQTTGEVRIANAGHPPLLHIDATGVAVYVGGATGLPLGVRPFTSYGEECFAIAPGETLVLFTDGLVERRGEPIDARLDLLAQRAQEAVAGGDGWCDRLVDAMIGARRDDDVALLGVRFDHWRKPELHVEVPAELPHLRTVRDRTRAWLVARNVGSDDVEALLLAVGEATGNAAVHAYGAAGGRLRLHAALDGEQIEIVVEDDGRWRPPLDDLGRGLQIIDQMSDSTVVDTGDKGTTVTFTRRLASHAENA
jgi:serine phosphatase RsbU (regulator of sigma subunit)/anti-sigma regulatory factor (Ser/Thr protein kinase)